MTPSQVLSAVRAAVDADNLYIVANKIGITHSTLTRFLGGLRIQTHVQEKIEAFAAKKPAKGKAKAKPKKAKVAKKAPKAKAKRAAKKKPAAKKPAAKRKSSRKAKAPAPAASGPSVEETAAKETAAE